MKTRRAKLCVLGLGYVGLPIAVEFAGRGFFVYGYDTKAVRIDALRSGCSYIDDIPDKRIVSVSKKFHPTGDARVLSDVDIIIICVPTPLRVNRTPDMSFILKATRAVSAGLRPGQLIILESTTYPGTTRDIMLPILKKKGLMPERDFFLAFSPERIDPGNKRYSFSDIPKIVGGISEASCKLSGMLYAKVIDRVIYVSSAETAEMVKLLENTFRNVNIGLVNEFAMLCHRLGVDVWEVVRAASTKPFGFMPFYPGPGIGGHCLPCDPLYLSWKARKIGFKTSMINLASKTNLFMPRYVVDRINRMLADRGIALGGARVLILGVTYKRGIKDLRESPALNVIEILQKENARVSYYDPYIPYLDTHGARLKSVRFTPAVLKKYDLVVLITDHQEIDYRFVAKSSKLIFDTRDAFGKAGVRSDRIIRL
ncbi:MAG: nucleotide sugar dehydrogenase [Candidatus Omnitrophota bacterium]